ncbi:pre-peptidase C-terminal domain-containing protein [Tahibacter amnicola]|uniref:Pre-peptidase C-terminal domain-containing protein n=1 Tax=Tahibacter amnicola TaxID=2976241 RepID=A0ABY6BBY9_9GAMM|nr:pre-peptidase C-terminal domain-containing protein [Tahibacter amnicola]UXI65830.1 pre-peptidase C-terminal domain-containing protein [Tahibacter amnicola]
MYTSRQPALARRLTAALCLLIGSFAWASSSTPEETSAHGHDASLQSPVAAQLAAPQHLSRKISGLKAAGTQFPSYTLLQDRGAALSKRPDLKAMVTDGTVLKVDDAAVRALLSRNPKHLTLPLPGHGELELVQENYDDLVVEGPGGEDLSWTNTAKHYQGVLKGNDRSVAAISIYRNLQTGAYEITGVYSTTTEGNTFVGRVKGSNPGNDHLVYRDSAVLKKESTAVECGLDRIEAKGAQPPAICDVDPTPSKPLRKRLVAPKANAALADSCVRLHMEVEYDVFQAQGSNSTNYATGFFNIAKTVYANENIPLNLYYLKVWTTPDPEANINGYQNIWNHFWNRMNQEGIQGDLAILVGFHIDRGIASLNRICGPDYNQAGISPIRDYPSYPTYSWAGATLPHEIGHLFGSEHTQACAWNGNNTALDGCAAPEGNCARPASRFGTIMSYCSNFSLAQGFGAQPGNLIRSSFTNATCLNCGGTGCTSTIAPTSANVAAGAGTGSVNITMSASNCSWTAASNTSWITITSGGGPFTGNGSTTYSVAANGSSSARTGTLTIAGKTFTVTQAAGGSTETPLSNNVPVSVAGAAGTTRLFYIDVPSGSSNLVIATSGGTGDLDLYTKFGSAPTTSAYDCRPYANGNTETCTVATPAAGRYYVMLHAYSAYSGATLKASFTATNTTTVDLTAPVGGETWTRGSVRTIRWTSTNSQHVDVALYRGGTFVQWIAWHVPSPNGSYNWTVPTSLAAGNNYTITVLDYDKRNITDSSGNFTIN